MTGNFYSKSLKSILLLGGILALFLAFNLIMAGCSSSDKSKTEADQSALPEEGDKTLLDTTTTSQPITQAPAEKPAVVKEEPKPKPKTQTTTTTPKAAEPEMVKTLLLAENSALQVSLLTLLKTDSNKVGDPFRAIYIVPTTAGAIAELPEGAILEGEVAEINDGKAKDEKAYIKLRFTKLLLPGETPIAIDGYLITKDGSGIIRPGEQGTTIAKDAALGAAAGGILGAITGGKAKDAVKGAVAGAAAGGVLGAVLHKDQVTLKEGRTLDVNVVTPVYQMKEKKGI
jgi:hypothetical protein